MVPDSQILAPAEMQRQEKLDHAQKDRGGDADPHREIDDGNIRPHARFVVDEYQADEPQI